MCAQTLMLKNTSTCRYGKRGKDFAEIWTYFGAFFSCKVFGHGAQGHFL